MYVYNKTGTMVSGPVTNLQVYERQYATDAINGEEVLLEVIIPKETFKDFDIQINNVIHGFKNDVVTPRAYNDSETCNIEINCTTGWENERDAVAIIFTTSGGTASGVLVNNGCQDLRSFFLTAEHVYSLGGSLANWVFRFNYDSPNPSTPNCRGSDASSWLTYSGATLKASNTTTDFALLELNSSVIGQSTLALAGWDRSSTTPNSGTAIHHPRGDVKKISGSTGTPTLTGQLGGTGTDYIRVVWGVGTTEPGSSGAPLFNTDHRMAGQNSSGNGACPTTGWTTYGRFFISWTGGGTNSTRLSNWLGGASSPTNTNTIRSPYVSASTNAPLCNSSSRTFTLNNLISGRTATWSVSPSSLVVTSSGSGTSAALQASVSGSGLATITFTISAATDCNPILVTKQVWIGLPSFTMTGSNYLCTNQPGAAFLNGSRGTDFTAQDVTSVSWTYYGALQLFSTSGQSAYYNGASSPGTGIIYANNVTNACGSSSPSMFFQVVSCLQSGDISMKVSPNPSMDFADIEIKKESLASDVKLENGDLTIYDKLGKAVLSTKFNGNREKIDISRLKPDIYFVEIVFENTRIREKILIAR